MRDVLRLAPVCAYAMVLGTMLAGPRPYGRDLVAGAWALCVLLAGVDLADGAWPMAVVWAASGALWAHRLGESYEVDLYPTRR